MNRFETTILLNQRALLWMELRRLDGRIDSNANEDRKMLQERVKWTEGALNVNTADSWVG